MYYFLNEYIEYSATCVCKSVVYIIELLCYLYDCKWSLPLLFEAFTSKTYSYMEDYTKMTHIEIDCEAMDWINMSRTRTVLGCGEYGVESLLL